LWIGAWRHESLGYDATRRTVLFPRQRIFSYNAPFLLPGVPGFERLDAQGAAAFLSPTQSAKRQLSLGPAAAGLAVGCWMLNVGRWTFGEFHSPLNLTTSVAVACSTFGPSMTSIFPSLSSLNVTRYFTWNTARWFVVGRVSHFTADTDTSPAHPV
jgi:hypothetical protein